MSTIDARKNLRLLRLSLIFIWISTAFVSVCGWHGQGLQLLQNSGIHDPQLASFLILGGAALDATLGLAMWLRPSRGVYLAALLAMSVMTIIATSLAPALWLDPLGPLTKNILIAAVLYILASDSGE